MAETFRMQVHQSDVRKGCPFKFVDMPREQEYQAISNHSQSFERLNERGGLGVKEMMAIINGLSWSHVRRLDYAVAVEFVRPYAVQESEANR